MRLHTYNRTSFRRDDVVLMRVDANVPIKDGVVTRYGEFRLKMLIPEIQELLFCGVKIVLMTHLGRPKGKNVPALSTKPIAEALSRHVGMEVIHVDGIGIGARSRIRAASGGIFMLENLRFYAGEEKNSTSFARSIAAMGDAYINNAFGVCHRKHASVHAITKYIDAYAGKLLNREIHELGQKIRQKAVLIVGGMKLETKIPIIEHLAPKVDAILTSGVVAIALISAAQGKNLSAGTQIITTDERKLAERILVEHGQKLHVPSDFRTAKAKQFRSLTIKSVHAIGTEDRLFDVGPKTVEHYGALLRGSKTIIWNGPMGYAERKQSAKGTLDLARVIASSRARTILGGGDTAAFLGEAGMIEDFSFVSTGGGAMLAFLAGGAMPGLEALE